MGLSPAPRGDPALQQKRWGVWLAGISSRFRFLPLAATSVAAPGPSLPWGRLCSQISDLHAFSGLPSLSLAATSCASNYVSCGAHSSAISSRKPPRSSSPEGLIYVCCSQGWFLPYLTTGKVQVPINQNSCWCQCWAGICSSVAGFPGCQGPGGGHGPLELWPCLTHQLHPVTAGSASAFFPFSAPSSLRPLAHVVLTWPARCPLMLEVWGVEAT